MLGSVSSRLYGEKKMEDLIDIFYQLPEAVNQITTER
jgi:hypothetical protein